jgi:hypothetical protein
MVVCVFLYCVVLCLTSRVLGRIFQPMREK